MKDEDVKIVSIKEENFKRVSLFEFRFGEDGILEIVGDNEQGKSSIIDAYYAAMCGKAAVPEKPIKDGEREGCVTVELDTGMTIERRFTKNGKTQLKVMAGPVELKKPQDILNGLIGHGYNLNQFLKPGKEQREILLSVSNLNIDWSKGWPDNAKKFEDSSEDDALLFIDAQIKDVKEEAKITRAALKTAKPDFDNARAALPEGKEIEPVSVSELIKQRDEAQAAINNQGQIVKAANDLKEKAVKIENEIAAMKDELNKTLELVKNADAEVELLGAVPDIAAIDKEIAGAEAVNVLAAKSVDFEKARDRLTALEKKMRDHEYLDQDLAEFKKHVFADAKFPIDGLGIDGEIVTWKGLPLSQASHSESLKVAVSIAMAVSPKLKVIILDDAEKFGDKSLQQILDTLKENKFQGIIARVGSDTKTPNGVIIEEGEVVMGGN